MATLISGGCMRLYPTNHATPGPRWHVNTRHKVTGIIDTTNEPTIDTSGFISFNLLHLPGRAVISLTAASDESLTGKGIQGGCSDGVSLCRTKMYKDGTGALNLTQPAHWALVAGALNNIWFTLVHDIPGTVEEVKQLLTDHGVTDHGGVIGE